MKMEIDVEEFAAQLKAGKGIGGKDGALTPLIKQLTEMALQAELETHLSQDLERNRKNGTTSKTMKWSFAETGFYDVWAQVKDSSDLTDSDYDTITIFDTVSVSGTYINYTEQIIATPNDNQGDAVAIYEKGNCAGRIYCLCLVYYD